VEANFFDLIVNKAEKLASLYFQISCVTGTAMTQGESQESNENNRQSDKIKEAG
jgi:hypothetical protein